ncbi:MAG: hypothetical protein H6719_23545 [Sandaracinaceae bacterium]|nr:hypothetical protein [Sandaracinaceae bacterium]
MARRVVDEGPEDLEVWAKTEKFRARRVYAVDEADAASTVAARVAQLDEAARAIADVIDDHHAEHRHLLAHGKRWSFGPVVTCQDGVIETHGRLAQVIDATREVGGAPRRDVLWDALTDAARSAGEHVYVEAGIEIEALMDALDARRLSVITAGSSSGQSLAGVINTSSHGGDFEGPPIPDMVRAVAIVGPDGVTRWVEPSAGLTRDGALATLLPSAIRVRDDDAFDAALVTIGALGVIVAYVVQVRPAYGLWETVAELDWPTVRPWLVHDGAIFDAPAVWSKGAPLDPAATYRSVEVVINPFEDPLTHQRRVHVVRRAEHPSVGAGMEDWERAGFGERVKNAFVAIGTLLRTISEDVDDYGPGVDALLRTGREDSGGFAPAHRVLNFGNTRLERVWSVDVVLPTSAGVHLAFLDEVLARFDALIAANLKFAGFLALRFSRPSRATLAMQSAAAPPTERFAQLELFLLQAPIDLAHLDLWREEELVQDGVQFYEAFCAIAEAYRVRGDLRVHWGQLMPELSSYAIPEDDARERWRRGRAALVGDRPYLFANAMMVEAGVVEPPTGFAFDGVLPPGRGDALERGHHLAVATAAPVADVDGTCFAVDATGRVSRREAAGRWLAIRPDEAVDRDRCPAGRLLVGRRSDGRRCLIARDVERRLRSTFERAPGVWSDWDRVGSTRVGEPALVVTPEGLELFAVSGHGLERWRERGDDDWRSLDRVPGGELLVGAVAAARVAGATWILGHAADDALVWTTIGAPGWTSVGASSRREPALVEVAGAAVAVWVTEAGRLAATTLGAGGPVHETTSQPGLSSTGRLHLAALPTARVGVTLADADRRLRRLELDLVAGFVEPAEVLDLDAVGGPLVVGDQLFVKVAHDLIVRQVS